MIAAVLHLDECTGAHRRRFASRVESGRHRDDVVGDAVLVGIGEDRVDSRVSAGIGVDTAAGEHEVRAGVEATQAADALARGRIRLRGDRAGVEHADVGGVGLGDDLAPARREPAGEIRHLREIHLAPEHGERDPKRTIVRSAHAGRGAAAVSRSPAPARSSDVATAPASRLGSVRAPR